MNQTTPGAAQEPAPEYEQFAEIDAETICKSYDTVLWAAEPLRAEDRDLFGRLLTGHVELLLPEVAALAGRTHGEQRRTALHVLRHTRPTLRAAGSAPDAVGLWDLATHCRALLTLYRHMRPLPEEGSG